MTAHSGGVAFSERHRVIGIDTLPRVSSAPYASRSVGYTRATVVDESTGAAHFGMALCRLAPRGDVSAHLHSHEETFFVLAGTIELELAGTRRTLNEGAWGFVPAGALHAWRNADTAGAQWVEIAAPRPRHHDDLVDTCFPGARASAAGPWPSHDPDQGGPSGVVGHFDGTLRGGLSQAGLGADVEGVRIEMLVNSVAGAAQSTLFIVEYDPGVELPLHDHPYEEGYLLLRGTVEAQLDGRVYQLGVGDALWAGTGSVHGFANRGSELVRWLEVQAPQPPSSSATRFKGTWERVFARAVAANDDTHGAG